MRYHIKAQSTFEVKPHIQHVLTDAYMVSRIKSISIGKATIRSKREKDTKKPVPHDLIYKVVLKLQPRRGGQ